MNIYYILSKTTQYTQNTQGLQKENQNTVDRYFNYNRCSLNNVITIDINK